MSKAFSAVCVAAAAACRVLLCMLPHVMADAASMNENCEIICLVRNHSRSLYYDAKKGHSPCHSLLSQLCCPSAANRPLTGRSSQ